MPEALLQVEALHKRFPVSGRRGALLHAVDDVSLHIAPGESVGLVGESGCGKSTLVRLLARLLDPSDGRIVFAGQELAEIRAESFARSPQRASIQMVFQDPTDSLNPRFSARDAIAEPLRLLTALSAAAVLGALLPAEAIVVDEANTAGVTLAAATAGAPAHDVLTLTGGAIGYGLPAAVGAAIAAPDRPVLAVQADGSAMYTISALWTQARERLNVTTVILNNGAYDILRIELARVGAADAAPGPKAAELLDLTSPGLDFVRIAGGMGVPARRVETAESLAEALRAAFAEPGPHLIDAVLPSLFAS